ncbi:50S ribosomal protein L18e [Candidatus Woesearchaeota archaeon]|nr:50S ribosomal protein L18e [Candidatus Woesearchaeota archaeon]
MGNRTGTSNPQLQSLIVELRKKAQVDRVPLWKRVAFDLEKPTRMRRVVNLSRLNRFTRDNEVIIVPGKVLGSGIIDHKITIAAFDFSDGAVEKLLKQNCDVLSIEELLVKNPKASAVRIMG